MTGGLANEWRLRQAFQSTAEDTEDEARAHVQNQEALIDEMGASPMDVADDIADSLEE